MKINEILQLLSGLAPAYYQESYDNTGLLTGNANEECTGIICTLDATEQVILEAKNKSYNLVVAHHPIIFSGLKKITGKTYAERAVIAAIKNDVAVYAIHTNFDNLLAGVNSKMADKLGLQNRQVLLPLQNTLMKLYVYVPVENAADLREAIFKIGAGVIGNYSEVSFSINGTGTFRPGQEANPAIGKPGELEKVNEEKIEVIFPAHLKEKLVAAVIAAHPYEEVAYDLISLQNQTTLCGSGLLGELSKPMNETAFLALVKKEFNLRVIRHTPLLNREVKKVALCGGAGSFLIKHAVASDADFYITSDVKYHEFFDAENKLVLADIGHWESEQFTTDLLYDFLHANFPTFAVLKSGVKTNPVNYFL